MEDKNNPKLNIKDNIPVKNQTPTKDEKVPTITFTQSFSLPVWTPILT